VAVVTPSEAAALLTDGAEAIALGSSAAFRAGHAPGAIWTIRPRLAGCRAAHSTLAGSSSSPTMSRSRGSRSPTLPN
jgi:hypothetical protein